MKPFCLFLLLLAGYYCPAQKSKLVIATYNLRYDNADDAAKGNGWKLRLPQIANLIRFYGFDIFGTQEGLHHQLQQLKDSLPGYDYIGVGRDDGREKGEHSAIFYNKTRFRLLDKANFWLAADTSKPNKGWDAVLPRICSWGLFREQETGVNFYFFNLHMDHIGVLARQESARLVMEKIRKLAGKIPVVLTGDFNADQRDAVYTSINNSGILSDAYTLSPVKWATVGTFNNFDPTRCSDARIDHIFLTPGFKVLRYAVLNKAYSTCLTGSDRAEQKFPSDHFPAMAVISY